MSGLIGSILATTNALKANQVAIETAGKNMANVNNAYYSRQRLEFGISGISASIVTQQRDSIIDSTLIREASETGSLEAKYKIYQQLQVIFGEQITGDVNSVDTLDGSTTGDEISGGLSGSISAFFNSLHALSSNPDDVPTKAAVIAQSEEMVSRFNTLAENLESLDTDILRSIDVEVDRANDLLGEIAELNGQISILEIRNPGAAHEFRDLRQQKLGELAKYINFSTQEISNGQIMIFAKDKGASGGNDVLLVDRTRVSNEIRYNSASNELYFTGHSVNPLGNSPNVTAYNVEGGSLEGYISTRSTTDPFGGASSVALGPLAKMQEDLDALAQEIATRVSAIYDDAAENEFFFDDDDNPDAITTANITAKNIRLYKGDPLGNFGTVIDPLNSLTLKATNTSNSGDNELALELAELSDFASSNLRSNTFIEFVSDMATGLGYEVSNNAQQLENQELIVAQLQDQRASVSGVSIDEELANMIRFQRSFEASARVLRVMDEMLELIVNGLVR